MTEEELLQGVLEGLRRYEQERQAEWAAKSFREKLGELWNDLPWLGRIVIFGVWPIAMLIVMVSIIIAIGMGVTP